MRALWLPGHPEVEIRGGQAVRLESGEPVFPGVDPQQFVTFEPLRLAHRDKKERRRRQVRRGSTYRWVAPLW